MTLQHLSILNFKNIAEAELDFSAGVNCMLGANGMGKSNLLEAIHYLSMVRAMRPVTDKELVMHGADSMMVKGTYSAPAEGGAPDVVSIGLQPGRGKRLKVNGKEYRRLSDHIGRLPVVTVCPDDTDLIRGAGSERRRLADRVISQADPTYLPLLIDYNKALETRNRMLREGVDDPLLYEGVEHTLCRAGEAIHERRRAWADEMAPIFADYYHRVAGSDETATMAYTSRLDEAPMQHLLDGSRRADSILHHTTCGIHRDDLVMSLDSHDMRRVGSQGQMKTFAIALRLAVFDFIRRRTGRTPILLLDDIFDKLDATRVGRIIETVSHNPDFGQIFITDTNRTHLDEILRHMARDRRLFEVTGGVFKTIDLP